MVEHGLTRQLWKLEQHRFKSCLPDIMDKKGGETIIRMGAIFDKMKEVDSDNPSYFEDILKQTGGDYGISMAMFYLCNEQELEEKGLIKTEI